MTRWTAQAHTCNVIAQQPCHCLMTVFSVRARAFSDTLYMRAGYWVHSIATQKAQLVVQAGGMSRSHLQYIIAIVFISCFDEFNGKFVFLIGGTLVLVATNFMACVFHAVLGETSQFMCISSTTTSAPQSRLCGSIAQLSRKCSCWVHAKFGLAKWVVYQRNPGRTSQSLFSAKKLFWGDLGMHVGCKNELINESWRYKHGVCVDSMSQITLA